MLKKLMEEYNHESWGINFPQFPDRFNKGMKFFMNSGTPVPCVLDGEVIEVCEFPKREVLGLFVWIQSGDTKTIYAHLDEAHVKKGDKVKAGDIIANSGTSGYLFEPMVYIAMKHKNQWVDPLSIGG